MGDLVREMPPNNFAELLERISSSGHHAHRYRDGDPVLDMTCGDLIMEADRIARGLHRLGARPGDRVGLVLYQPRDFVPAFLACVRAGLIAVPLYPPLTLGRLAAWTETTGQMLRTAGASLLLADPPIASALDFLKDTISSLREVVSMQHLPEGGDLNCGRVTDDQVVFLQFTSGSTSAARGVRVTHGSLWANAHAIMVDGLRASSEDRGVTWLPLYHDMGLIGFVMAPFVTRTPVTFLGTLDFLKRPESWARTLSEDRGTISFSPNFGFALAANRTKSTEGLDLTAVRVLGCGAEPIQPNAINAFFDRFAEAGLDRKALLACYGLAEATLAVTFASLEDELKVDSPGSVVSCGRALPGHRVSILDESGNPAPDRQTGEILVEGPSVADGYWGDERATKETFIGGAVRTGDLGYISDGELFVTARSKDMIIIRGRNIPPSPIETSASRIDGVRQGNVAAFSAPSDLGERIVVAAEHTARAAQEVVRDITRAVQHDLGLTVSEVLLIEPGSLPKTTSGKLQRSAARNQYLEGRLGVARRRGV